MSITRNQLQEDKCRLPEKNTQSSDLSYFLTSCCYILTLDGTKNANIKTTIASVHKVFKWVHVRAETSLLAFTDIFHPVTPHLFYQLKNLSWHQIPKLFSVSISPQVIYKKCLQRRCARFICHQLMAWHISDVTMSYFCNSSIITTCCSCPHNYCHQTITRFIRRDIRKYAQKNCLNCTRFKHCHDYNKSSTNIL